MTSRDLSSIMSLMIITRKRREKRSRQVERCESVRRELTEILNHLRTVIEELEAMQARWNGGYR